MLVCIAVFRTPVSLLGGVGSAIAIVGSYIYAMTKTQEKMEADKAAAKQIKGCVVDTSVPTGRIEHPFLPLMKIIGKTGMCG